MLINKEHVKFKMSRSHGPGGENHDHRSTKVHLWVKVSDLPITDKEKKMVREKLSHHINHEDEIWLENQETRSQEMNKDKALEHLNLIIEEALKIPAPRVQTGPPKIAEENRIQEKKIISRKKAERRIKLN